MNALLFTHIYPTLREPTRGPYNHSVFDAIAKRCEARVIVPEPWWGRVRRPRDLFVAPRENHTGIEATLPTFWSIPRIASLHARGMYLSLRSNVKRMHLDRPFDVIFAAWSYPDAVAASLLARDLRCPLVVKILGSDINELPHIPALRSQIRQGLEQAYRVITVSAALRERVLELGISPEKVLVQHNGVDGERFSLDDRNVARAELGLSTERPLLCYVGRLGQEKGLDVLLNAMHLLKRAGRNDVDLVIIGGGELEQMLRAQSHMLQLENQVRFVGMRSHAEIPRWISSCDALCLPSRREGCPNVVLEALASGRPVVASRVGGVPEIVNERNGLLVPAEDATALADSLETVLKRAWKPQHLRDSVESLSWDSVGERYFAVLKEAVEVQKSGRSSVLVSPETSVPAK